MKEIWKDINNNYQVSNFGNIKNKTRILKCSKHNNGYLYIKINGKQFSVHRLVAQAFIQNPNKYPVINHIDGNKLNNKISNLEWCTYKHNMQHAFKNKLVNLNTVNKKRSELKNIKKATISNYKKINMYDKNKNYIKTFNNIIEASEESKANYSHIIQCCKHKQKTCGGFIWEYENEKI